MKTGGRLEHKSSSHTCPRLKTCASWGACERIKKTPIPFSYAVYIKIFISLYGLMLPFGLYHDFGLYAIPLTMFIFFAMLGIELMAGEIEEPFGLDCNDLPTGDIP